jgi:hypothetical protein
VRPMQPNAHHHPPEAPSAIVVPHASGRVNDDVGHSINATDLQPFRLRLCTLAESYLRRDLGTGLSMESIHVKTKDIDCEKQYRRASNSNANNSNSTKKLVVSWNRGNMW